MHYLLFKVKNEELLFKPTLFTPASEFVQASMAAQGEIMLVLSRKCTAFYHFKQKRVV